MTYFHSTTLTAALLVLVACGQDQAGPSPQPEFGLVQAANLVTTFSVAPALTDPGINTALEDHIVHVPTGPRNGRLLVYLPSSRAPASSGGRFQVEAAKLGYHVIGLSYPNNPGLVSFCGPSADPNTCYETTRIEVITGEPVSDFVTISVANSIDNRLAKLLQWLAANRPGEGWQSFLSQGAPKWRHIVVAGHSQGAGHAVMIAKLRLVSRVVMLSGVTDAINGAAAAWVEVVATPPDRFFGLVHLQDNQFRPGVLSNWTALGMDVFGPAVAPDASSPPYEGTHRLITDILPSNGSYVAPAPHGSTGVDLFTPIDAEGRPLLAPVWRYLLGY